MKKKLPRIEVEDVDRVLKRFNDLGIEKFTESLLSTFMKENPLVLTQIGEANRQMDDAEDIDRAKEINLICVLLLYATLTEAMKSYPDTISDSDKLPTVSEKIVLSTVEQYLRKRSHNQAPDDLTQKLRRLKSENPGIRLLLKLSLSELNIFIKMFNVDDKLASLIYGFMGTHMLLLYEVLEAQAECNKLQKLFGDFGNSQDPK